MANIEILEKVYTAIGTLRAKGHSNLNVGLVANTAGIARSTLYLEDDDWKEVRAVIKGKPSTRVKLVQVDIEETSNAARQIISLSRRIAEAEEEVLHIKSVADIVYRELIDEVQRWFAKASEKPARDAKVVQFINELNSTRKELERLRSQNQVLQARISDSDAVLPLVNKEIIQLNALAPPGETFASFLKQLDEVAPQRGTSYGITAAYVMCGWPGSGKSFWIQKHRPSTSGTHLYVDSIAHTSDLRRFIADRLRVTTKTEVHCVWLKESKVARNERVSSIAADTGSSLEEEIRRGMLSFEDPTFNEPFSSFIVP